MKTWKAVSKEINMIIKGKRKQRPDRTPERIYDKSPEKKKLKEKKAVEESPPNKQKKDEKKEENEKAEGKKTADKSGKIESIENSTLISCRGANLNQVDMNSMCEKGYLTDGIIHLATQSILEIMEEEMKNERLDIVAPNVANLIQNSDYIDVIENQKRGLGLDELDWVLYPVNDKKNPEEGDGGSHWSLLLFSKKENKYFHFDPIKGSNERGLNERHAKKLHIKLLDIDSYDKNGNLPPMEEVDCKRQANGYDCGIYIIMYTFEILTNIKEGKKAIDVRDLPYKVDEMRNLLKLACDIKISQRRFKKKEEQNLIHILKDLIKNKEIKEKEKVDKARKEKSILEKAQFKGTRDTVDRKKSEDKEKHDKRKDRTLRNKESINYRIGKCRYDDNCRHSHKKDNTKEESERKKERNEKYHGSKVNERTGVADGNKNRRDESRNNGGNNRQRVPCRDFFQSVCRFGNYCRYEHPEICKSWEELGRCKGVNGGCEKPHPFICRSYTENEICHKTRCRFLHPRQRKRANERTQQRAPSRIQDLKLERDRYNYNRSQGVQRRRHFLPHQGRGPYTRYRSDWEGKNTDVQWTMVRRMVREEMEDSMRRGWYPKRY